jgi:LysR family transcriptional activator of nhaA
MLLPAENTGVRRDLDSWFDSQGIRPQIAGEFQDHALLRAFGQEGIGVFAIPSVFEKQLQQQGSLQRIGRTEDVRSRFYAISVERKLKHPAVLAICDTARRVFG